LTLPESLETSKIVFYARGGGVGHFNRAYAITRCLLNHGIKPLIISSSAFLPLAFSEQIQLLRWPGGLENNWPELQEVLLPTIKKLSPDLLIVDTFPEGPENELQSYQGARFFIQRDAEHSWHGPGIHARPEDHGYIINRSPEELLSRAQARQCLRAETNQPLILLTHNGNPAETTAFFWRLLKTLEPLNVSIRMASLLPCPRSEWQPYWIQHFPLSEWMNGVDLLIGGGGYNLVAEVQAYGVPALLTAFERPIDQQAQRIQNLPHFHAHHTAASLRNQIQKILSSPRPTPESRCNGAQKAAELILNLLQSPALK